MKRLPINTLFPNAIVGMISGTICVSFELSFAVLIFLGRLAEHLSFGVGLVLFSVAITSILIILFSACPQIVMGSAAAKTAILAWTAKVPGSWQPLSWDALPQLHWAAIAPQAKQSISK
jgi:hypothetical protein